MPGISVSSEHYYLMCEIESKYYYKVFLTAIFIMISMNGTNNFVDVAWVVGYWNFMMIIFIDSSTTIVL